MRLLNPGSQMAEAIGREVNRQGGRMYAFGGIGVWLAVGVRGRELLAVRGYHLDIDVWAPTTSREIIDDVLVGLRFERATYLTPAVHIRYCLRHCDHTLVLHAFFGRPLKFCFEIPIACKRASGSMTLLPSELLISKLQIERLSLKDRLDVVALVLEDESYRAIIDVRENAHVRAAVQRDVNYAERAMQSLSSAAATADKWGSLAHKERELARARLGEIASAWQLSSVAATRQSLTPYEGPSKWSVGAPMDVEDCVPSVAEIL